MIPQDMTMRVLLANWRLQRAHLDREIDFQEASPYPPDARILDELRGLAAELDDLIEGCVADQALAVKADAGQPAPGRPH